MGLSPLLTPYNTIGLAMYEVVVSNVGRVCRTKDKELAQQVFKTYSYSVGNRSNEYAYGNDVRLLEDGKVIEEFFGPKNDGLAN